MKKLNLVWLSCLALSALFFTSCSSDDDSTPEPEETGDFVNGMFILNEGNFGAGNATVSFLNEAGVLQNDIFQSVNGENLGDTAQSMYTDEDKIYIVLNGSGTVEVINRFTFEHLGTISTGLSNPRFFTIENGKGFVSNWGDPSNADDDFIAVVDLASNSVSSTISVSEGPERMESENGKVYVAHTGGWNTNNQISVISATGNSVSSTITVGDIPNSIVEENGKLYVLCGGKPAWTNDETLGSLFVINTSDFSIQTNLDFPVGQHPSQMVEENGALFYTIDAAIYTSSLSLNSLPTAPIFSVSDQGVYGIYGFEVEDEKIYVADAGDFASNGKVYIYSLNGNLENEFTVGLLPNGFAFND